MSSYNGYNFQQDQVNNRHIQESPTIKSVQVRVPRIYPGEIRQSNVLSVKANHSYTSLPQDYSQNNQKYGQPRGSPSTPTSLPGHIYASTGPNGIIAELQTPPIDYQLLLLSLAEDYLATAYGKSSTKELAKREIQRDLYYKLISTGLGCLEAALKQGRLQPNIEAVAQLRYASTLYQETENYLEAEEALSKGISLCGRHRMYDLKYNMQHLLARVMFATNSRASLKFLDGIIKDVEVYQHHTWVYAFRLLRAILSVQIDTPQDSLVAINHLRIISSQAKGRGDNAVLAISSSFEAMVHLHRSNSAETIEQAQRALAAARSSQLDPIAQQIPQLSALMHFIDISCSMQQWDPGQAIVKMQGLQSMLDASSNDQQWTDDGVIYIPLNHKTAQTLPGSGSQSGIVEADHLGNLTLLVNWLPKEEIYALGYLISAAVVSHRNAMDGHKTEQYLKEAKRMLGGMMDLGTGPLFNSISRSIWRQVFSCQIQVHLIFALCSRTAWAAAREQLLQLKKTVADLPAESTGHFNHFICYLEALICQGTGDIGTALSIYLSPLLVLQSPNESSLPSQIRRDLSILSALNVVLIVRSPTHPSHSMLNPLLATLESLAPSNPSKNIQSAYHLIRATSHSDDKTGIVKTKQYLQSALQAAKHCANNQLMCITLNFMSWKFFRGVVAEQAEKGAVASQSLAKKGKDSLWTSVANGVLADTLNVQGKSAEAEVVRKEGIELAGRLPVVMQREIEGNGNGIGGNH